MWLLTLALLSSSVFTIHAAGELKLQARLIWGTDSQKPNDPNLKDLDEKLTAKLKGVFKWKNYFEVNRQQFSVSEATARRVKMSPKCEVEVQSFGKAGIEVKLFGEGNLLRKVKQVIPPGEHLVIAGDDKNSNAWFVVITSAQ